MGISGAERTFDWNPYYDARSRNYGIAELLVGATTLRNKHWPGAPHLNQGKEGACVGFGWAHEGGADPIRKSVSYTVAMSIYNRAKRLDAWPGTDYSGTSVLAGAKAVKERGWMPEYRWAFSLSDALGALAYKGPIVMGCNWHRDMVNPGPRGYLSPTGRIIGGHCVMIKAINIDYDRVTIHNSWGASWGMKGDAYLSFNHLNYLINDGAELCIPVRRT
jgi:hypothetical protein